MEMKKALTAVIFFLLLAVPAASAETISLTLRVGQSVTVNGIPIEFADFSGDGRAAFRINGTTYVLLFGDTVKVTEGLNMTVGSLKPEEGEVHIILSGDSVSVESLPGSIALETQFPSKVAKPGEQVTFSVTVRNNGGDAFVPLSVEVPSGWGARITEGSSEITGIYLRHGESAQVLVAIETSTKTGRFDVLLHAGESQLKLTVTVKEGGVGIQCDYPVKEVEAGESVSFQLRLSSPSPTVVSLSAEIPEKWSAKFLAGGEPVRAVRVSGESTVRLVIGVPSDTPVGMYNVTVKAGNAEETLGVYVNRTHAGENGTLSVRVTDEDSGTYVAGARVELIQDGKTVTEAKTLSDGTASIEAPEGHYTVRVSKESYRDVERSVEIKAGRKKELQVRMRRLPYYMDISVPEPSKSQVLGRVFTYEVILRNLGREDDTYSLSLSVPQDWGGMVVEDPSSHTGITSAYVRSGEEKKLYVLLIPPDTAELGTYRSTLRVASAGSGEEREINLTARLTGSYGLTVTLERYSLKVNAGDEAKTTVRVYNTGTSPLTNVGLEVKAPKGWNVKVEPRKVPSLERDDEVEFTIEVAVPENVDAGDYLITLNAISDQKTKETSIRVTVSKGSGQTYLGLAIILGALLVLGLLLRRYGRR
ncbi:PEGA domain-containing protein [Thermococcus indicus]|uniref:PEGA domain-containing protein n=1 Tax=Thermococcus indicus TaxID=2586643 RepID=A0A4Y5SIJ5_9EURY|nr:NEW3 domain-containing protein [Thermococcus indicus]QDA30505.1 PEGA domain-containing protein [Thermococcus indicus]